MKPSHSIHRLSKFLVTILGRQPDEFGLLPDEEGYVTIKSLMKVLAEESGWGHVRTNQIRELIFTSRSPVIEMDDNRVRAVDRSKLSVPQVAEEYPKVLYYPVRRRACPGILSNGLRVIDSPNRIILAADKTMAQRLGRRIDPLPVILTVNTGMARSLGAGIWRYGKKLYLLDGLPSGCFTSPRLPKRHPETKRREIAEPPTEPKTPGSYLPDLTSEPQPADRSAKKRSGHKNEWKRERKRRSRIDTFGPSDR